MTPVLETLPAAAPDLPVAPWGMLAAIDLHGCFVDVFSCRPFDADVAAEVAVEHLGGTPTATVLQR